MTVYKLTDKAKDTLTFNAWLQEKGSSKGWQNGGCSLSHQASMAITNGLNKPPSQWTFENLRTIAEQSPLAEREIARFAYEQMGRKDLAKIVPKCMNCSDTGERAVFPGGIGPANGYAIVFCCCEKGREMAREQTETLADIC